MIDQERGDAHGAVVVDHAFAHVVRVDRRAGGGMFLQQVAAVMDVVAEKLEHGVREARHAGRPVQLERARLPPELPRRVEQVRQARGVIGVEVREEDRLHVLVLEIRAGDTHRRTAAGVDDEPFVAGDDGGGGAGVVRVGTRIASAEEDDGDRDGTMNDE